MNIVGFLPQSFSDWPGNTAAVVFTQGCNFRCGFCHNPLLVEFKERSGDNEKVVLEKLNELKWSLDGVTISGGEPTMQEDLAEFCRKLRAMDYRIKLDTNGGNPEALKKLIQEKLVDYFAMDLKTSAKKYEEVTKFKDVRKVKESIRLIISSGVDHEFRTTFVPDVMTKQDVIDAVSEIKGARRFVLQKFVPRECLDKAYEKMRSPSYDELLDIANSIEFSGEIRIRGEHAEVVVKKQQ
jgi:pyruvate formate lyase activating enzyme